MVSIIVPVFNREDFLYGTIESVLAQTYPHWELILIDDGSTDNSLSILHEMAAGDARIKVIERERGPKGASTCRNIGLEMASGKYIMFLDSDDFLEPFCLYQRVKFMSENCEIDYSVWNINKLKFNGELELWCNLNYQDDLKSRLLLTSWQTSAPIYRSDTLSEVKWDEAACSWQDWEFAIKLLLDDKLKYTKLRDSLPDVKVNRQHKDNISSTSRSFDRIECLFKLILKNEKKIIEKGKKEYLEFLRFSFFNFMEIAAIEVHNKAQFQVLYSYFLSALTFEYYKNKLIVRQYLFLQNYFNRNSLMQAFLYRGMKFILKKHVI